MKTVRIAWGLVFSFVVLLCCGCATNRGILDVRVPQPPNPAMGRKVIISRVTDKRVFEEAPRTPSVPSLKGEAITDKTITSRAIGQKRNSYGKALGDRLLPEGRTVEDLVREALTQSFRDAGYCVLDGTSPSGDVVPIEADIEQFWAWYTPGILAVSLEFEAKVQPSEQTSIRSPNSGRGCAQPEQPPRKASRPRSTPRCAACKMHNRLRSSPPASFNTGFQRALARETLSLLGYPILLLCAESIPQFLRNPIP